MVCHLVGNLDILVDKFRINLGRFLIKIGENLCKYSYSKQ